MFRFHYNKLFWRALTPALLLAGAQLLSASVVFQYTLPTSGGCGTPPCLNQAAGANRTNASVIEGSFPGSGSGTGPFIVGDDFILSAPYEIVTSLTVWVIGNDPTATASSGPTDTLDQEFTSLSLYTGYSPDGSTLYPMTLMATLSSAQLAAATSVKYSGTTNYQSLNNTNYYSIWGVTFSGLSWYVPAGQITYFGVGGVPIGNNTLALSASVDPNVNVDDPFLFFTAIDDYTPTSEDTCFNGSGQPTSPPCASTDIVGFNELAVVNVSMQGFQAPEPTSMGLLGLGIVGLAFKLRRRN